MNIFSVVKYWLNQGQKTWFSSIFEGWKNHQPLSLLSRYCVFLFFLFFCFSSEHSHVFFSLLGHDLALIFNWELFPFRKPHHSLPDDICLKRIIRKLTPRVDYNSVEIKSLLWKYLLFKNWHIWKCSIFKNFFFWKGYASLRTQLVTLILLKIICNLE